MAGYNSKKSTETLYEELISSVRAGKVAPIYYLMGEEPYFIDKLADFLVDTFVPEEDRDFNLITLYGPETDMGTVLTSAMSMPMMGGRTVILVREAQGLRDIDRMEKYVESLIAKAGAPYEGNILIFCHKNGKLDGRKKVGTKISKAGVVFESARLAEYQLPKFIANYVKSIGYVIEPQAAQMLLDHIGADLNRMTGDIDKLLIALPEGSKNITAQLVLDQIGVSKQFNIFELQDALAVKDVRKVNQIAKYFDSNQKEYPPQKVLPNLFKFFSNLMLAYYCPDRTEKGIALYLGMGEWQVRKNVLPAMRMYNARKVMDILGAIRRCDARSKGVDATGNLSSGDLMKELFFFILH